MTRNRLGLVAILAALALLTAPAVALAASPYTTSTAWTNTHSTPCMAAPGAVPVQIGSTVAVPCTFQEITTTVVRYTQHIPHAVYTTVTVPHTAYWTTTSQVPYTAYRQVTRWQSYTAYRTVTYTRYRTYYETKTVRVSPFERPVNYCYLRSGSGSGYVCYVAYWVPVYNYSTVTVPVTVAYTSSYSVPYTAWRQVTTTQAYTAYRTETFTHSRTWYTTEQVPTGSYTWTTAMAGTSTSSSSHTLSSWLDPTPLAGSSGSGSGNCGPGFCGPWYVIPTPSANP